MIDLLQIVGSLGVGAFLGLIIFLMYRRDRVTTEKMWRESKKFTEDRLTDLIEKDQETRQENTKVLTELRILIERLNGRHQRK